MKKHRILTSILTLCINLLLMPTLSAPEIKADSQIYYQDSYTYKEGYFKFQIRSDENNNYSASLLEAEVPDDEILNIVIPETVKGFPVKCFNYFYSSDLKYDELVDAFSKYSFSGCNINSAEFPEYMEIINTQAFSNHAELKNIILKSNNLIIGENAFSNTGITELTLYGSPEIRNQAFYACKNLKQVSFEREPEIIIIQKEAFKNCVSLENLIISENCKQINIGRSAFENTKIKNIEINSDCTIDIDSFAGCPLESVIINSDNAEIKLDAFADCKNLRKLKLSKACNLSQNAFANCTALENVNIDTSENITGSAFNGCTNLTFVNGEQVFDENTGDFIPKYKDFIMNNFNLADDIGFINQYVQANVKKIVAENITPDMNDMQKVRTLHDWVCSHTSYSPAGQESHNDAAILMNDTTVCEGYSRLCNLLYHEAGLETYYVTGVNHAWNIVNIDGHYFHVDSTWDDSSDEINYKWFCKSDSEMKEAGGNHASWKTAVISSLHDFQENITPECNYQMGDMNTDNEINIADMVKLEKYILNAENPDNNLILSDLNFDGITDVFDMIEMRKKVTE